MPRLDEATLSMLRRKVTDADLEEAQLGNVVDVTVSKAAIGYVRVDHEGQTQQVSAVRGSESVAWAFLARRSIAGAARQHAHGSGLVPSLLLPTWSLFHASYAHHAVSNEHPVPEERAEQQAAWSGGQCAQPQRQRRRGRHEKAGVHGGEPDLCVHRGQDLRVRHD